MPPISTRFAPPKARRALPVSENPETTRSREYRRAQFGFEAERRRIATKHRTRKSRAIDKLVKEEHFQSLDAAAQEQAIQQIKADCSEAAAEELAQVVLRSESRDTRKELRNSRRTRREGRRTSQGHRRTRTRLLRMNCCKLRYMKILGGLRAVPEKPNLTNVLTRTPFMTVSPPPRRS